jgi:hypothetical protein
MSRKLAPVFLVLFLVGCAGSSKLTHKSEEKLASGDAWKAWKLATKALDKEPGNPRARSAATAAGISIVQEWQRRIRALAELDSLKAAEEVLELAQFREDAARYATIPVGPAWPEEERAIRQMAAWTHYRLGREAQNGGRPKKAWMEFSEAERFVPGYRDVSRRADRVMSDAMTRVVVLPFRTRSADPSLGVQVAQAWREDLAQSLAPPRTRFTLILDAAGIERSMRVSDLDGLTRERAIRLARETGAQRALWGSIDQVRSTTRLHFFRDTVARRVVERDSEGRESVRWVDVPIEVIARVREVSADGEYDVLAVPSGASLAHRRFERATSARVVWTSYQPEGDPASYSLVSETVRTENPDRARDVEERWKAVCGAGTTLVQVLEARRSARSSGHYAREALPRFAAGAAFVFLEELPPAEDLAYVALTHGFSPARGDLLQLDTVDDVDLSLGTPDPEPR